MDPVKSVFNIIKYEHNVYKFNLPSNKNQDRGLYIPISNKDIKIIMVCDGHGISGSLFSEFTINFVSEYIETSDFSQPNLNDLINNLFSNLESTCKSINGGLYGGTTVSLLILRKNDIWVANLGDSECILFNKSDDSYEKLSSDHSPLNVEEYLRIIKEKPNTVFQYDTQRNKNIIHPIYDSNNEKNPPPNGHYIRNVEGDFAAYYGNGQNLKLSLTRSIGDFEFKDKHALSAIPEIKHISRPLSEDEFIIIASDGFWDCWKYSEIVPMIKFQKESNVSFSEFESFQKNRAYNLFGNNPDDTLIYIIY